MLRKGREVRSWTDYILGTNRRLFGNVKINLVQIEMGSMPRECPAQNRRFYQAALRFIFNHKARKTNKGGIIPH